MHHKAAATRQVLRYVGKRSRYIGYRRLFTGVDELAKPFAEFRSSNLNGRHHIKNKIVQIVLSSI